MVWVSGLPAESSSLDRFGACVLPSARRIAALAPRVALMMFKVSGTLRSSTERPHRLSAHPA
jgi:hypothetical protein